MDVILFLIFAIIAVVCAVNVVVQTHPISSAISLIGVMGALAVLYLLLGAEFLAMAQIIVYAGAVMVLFIFVIMLLNAGEEERTQRSKMARQAGAPLALILLSLLTTVIYRQLPRNSMAQFGDFAGQTAPIGRLLFREFLLPFEVVSVLILIAIVGAVVLARKEL